MRRYRLAAAVLCGMLLLTGCKNKTESTAESSLETSATDLTVFTTTTPILTTAAATTLSTETTTTSTVPMTTATTTADFEHLVTAQSVLTTQQIGGQGGEEHAEDPAPLYFTYRFGADSVSMRLAGGNYQTISYDFSESVQHTIEELYTLSDFNFDGNPDLVIPVQFSNANTVYAVFLWNPETLYYETEPLLITNPVPHADKEQITSLARSSAAVWIMTTYTIGDGSLTIVKTATADFDALTLTVQSLTDDTDPIVTEYTSAEELEAALTSQP